MLRAAGARRLTRTLSRCPTRAKNHVRLISFLGLVFAALLFFSAC
jgi:hypothetical protein